MTLRNTAVILVSLALSAVAAAQTPGFYLVGFPDGWASSGVNGISGNGAVAVGAEYPTTPNPPNPGFRWTAETGRVDFDYGPGMPTVSAATATDTTGHSIVGVARNGGGFVNNTAYLKVGDGPFQNLGILPGRQYSTAYGVSGDGSVVVGGSTSGQSIITSEAFRWTAATGMVGLGYTQPNGSYSEANGVSRDGTTIVGQSQSGGPGGDTDAFKWTASGGMQKLPSLAVGPDVWERAQAANADGSIIVGTAGTADINISPAAYWDTTGVHSLPLIENFTAGVAYGVSDNGQVIAGNLDRPGVVVPFVWTAATSTMRLSDYLLLYGIQIPSNYTLSSLNAVSGDGLTFGGEALNTVTNRPEGFVVTIPGPSSFLVFALAGPLARRKRLSALSVPRD